MPTYNSHDDTDGDDGDDDDDEDDHFDGGGVVITMAMRMIMITMMA